MSTSILKPSRTLPVSCAGRTSFLLSGEPLIFRGPKGRPKRPLHGIEEPDSLLLPTLKAAKRLASPIRMCQLTRARLPSSFLIPFTLSSRSVENKQVYIEPSFESAGARGQQRKYLLNSQRLVAFCGRGAWKRMQFASDAGHVTVWRPDMVDLVQSEMKKHDPKSQLNP